MIGESGLVQTQDISDMSFSDDEVVNHSTEIWGRLLPLVPHFRSVELKNDKYTFGRSDGCDFSFSVPKLRRHASFNSYSNVHFNLLRETSETGSFTFLEDLSSNGTFINGIKVGKNRKQVLNNDDEISLLVKNNKVFVYNEINSHDHQFPDEVTSKFTVLKTLGRGACGEVKLVFTKEGCRALAMKIINKKNFSSVSKKANPKADVMNEVKLLQSLEHPCIIKIEEVIQTADFLYIILELVSGGELFDRVVDIGKFPEPEAKFLFYQMLQAVKYLHDRGITHRDLKPENILLVSYENESLIKVTDFGISKFVDSSTLLKTLCGTPTYLAPEILLSAGSGSYTNAIDCWSLGVILFVCLGGYQPFSEDYRDMPLFHQIIKGCYDFKGIQWKGVSASSKDLIRKLLIVDPNNRLTVEEALNHPWMKDEAIITKAKKIMYPDEENCEPSQAKKLKTKS